LALVVVAVSAVQPQPVAPSGPLGAHLVIRGGGWTIDYQAAGTRNNTAFSVLREASIVQGFELDWVDYDWPYEDVFVTSINGTRNNGAANLWWQYCVNGAYADVGALHRAIDEGDVVRWVYAAPGGNELCG
jgi:hypothetical protein